ncbi:MAG: sigma-70 family RNA polymerase sigma factor [Verrucomicrobiae bacterium]|nr:sigma-70 family RNA polymerase sigma factor [Verrucomicrobiae bacterium]
MAAQAESGDEGMAALERLCAAYYRPIYAYARRKGSSPEDAEDLTQGFFGHVIASGLLAKPEPGAGRLRTYLLTAFRNFAAKERRRGLAKKRGGGNLEGAAIPRTSNRLESDYLCVADRQLTPEQAYERKWALALIDAALGDVGECYARTGRKGLFEQLRETLIGTFPARGYGELAEQLGINEGAVRTAVHRLRSRFREALLARVSETVVNQGEIEDELRHIKSVLAS